MHGASATVWTFAPVTAAKSKPRHGAGGGHTPWGSAGRGAAGGSGESQPTGMGLRQWF